VRVVDLVPPFRERRDPGLFVDSVHCGREGYGLVAETLAPVLAKILTQKAAAPARP
jgi:lysophospholipase L1-like esterase